MTWFESSETTLVLVARLSAIAPAIASAELLWERAPLRDDGLMSWPVARLRHRLFTVGALARIMDLGAETSRFFWVLAARIAVAAAIVAAPAAWVLSPWLVWPMALTTGLLVLRCEVGMDGSDQLSWAVWTSLALAAAVPTPRVQEVSLGFIAFQVLLSYLVAGIAKTQSRLWWDGTAVRVIANLRVYGHPGLGPWLRRHPGVAAAASRTVIFWECVFPVAALGSGAAVPWVLATGVVFHAANALIMGLNCFFWAFVGAYPAVGYIAHRFAG